VTAHRDRIAEFRADPETAYRHAVDALPDGPSIEGAERTSKLIGKLELPNKMRPAARPGLALVGDAALASDPLFGVGCGWAFQSAEWLVDHTQAAITGRRDLDSALGRYRRTFRSRLGLHHWFIADFSTGRRMRTIERLGLRRATRHAELARAIEEVMTRRRSPLRLLDPRLAPGALRRAPSGA
jgi:flavin-dependent dehydrogenase